MPAFEDVLKPEEIKAVSVFVFSQPRRLPAARRLGENRPVGLGAEVDVRYEFLEFGGAHPIRSDTGRKERASGPIFTFASLLGRISCEC